MVESLNFYLILLLKHILTEIQLTDLTNTYVKHRRQHSKFVMKLRLISPTAC